MQIRITHSLVKVVLGIFLCAIAGVADALTLPKGIIQPTARPAPALHLKDMDGNVYDIKNSAGHWVFVHFWASWCGPCRREMPDIQKLIPKLDPKRWQIAIINTAESEDTVYEFIAQVAPDISPLLDSDGLATQSWQPRGLPSTFLVDPQGIVRFVALGGREWDKPEYLQFLREISAGK